MQTIVLASSNTGKISEFKQLFPAHKFKIVPQSEFDIEDVAETATTFVENALIKARHASKLSGLPAIADDSGIVIDALQGKPGVLSARYAGEHGDAKANYEKVLQELKHVPNEERCAHFHCTLVMLQSPDDPEPIIATGRWYGSILCEPIGLNGFGYDPIFYVAEHDCSAAELENAVKNQLSHRVRATQSLFKQFKQMR